MAVITKAYENFVSQAVGQFDMGVDVVAQAVRSFWPDLDMARLEQALNHLALQFSGVAEADTVLHATGSELSKVSQPNSSTGSPTTATSAAFAVQTYDLRTPIPNSSA